MRQFSDRLSLLHKYRPLNGEWGRRTVEDVLLHARLYWQSPAAFNDPFDCAPSFYFGRDAASREAFIRRAVSNVLTRETRIDRRLARQRAKRRRVAEVTATLEAGFHNWMGESALCCFSEVGDVPLMWAHYADSHRGVCFVFQEQMRPEPFIAFEVRYSAERPRVDLTDFSTTDTFDASVLTKDLAWSYERERRMLDYRSPAGYRLFPPNVLIGILLGARISPEDREFVLDINRRRATPLPVQQAVLHPSRYEIAFTPLRQN